MAEDTAVVILAQNRELLVSMAAALLEKGMLEGSALDSWTAQVRGDDKTHARLRSLTEQ